MSKMRKLNARFPATTIQKMDEILQSENEGIERRFHKSRGALIREMVDAIIDKRWKPPLFADRPAHPIQPKPTRRKIDHTKTPAARAYNRKYLKAAKRRKYARA